MITCRRAPRALLLDLDNTLVDRDTAFTCWLATLGVVADSFIALDRGGHGDRRALFSALAGALQTTPARARSRFESETARLAAPKPGACAFLSAFPGRKVVITNGRPSVQRAKATAAGVDRHVDGLLVSSDIGVTKPDPRAFRAALALAGVRPEDALMIGDHPVHDIAGAEAAGIPALMIRTQWFQVPHGVRAVDNLTEIAW